MKTHTELLVESTLNKVTDYIEQNGIRGDTLWTLHTMRFLADAGYEKGYEVCVSGFKDEYHAEWLYDMVWYKEVTDKKYLSEIELIIECEWSTNIKQIKYDFEKLLTTNAANKLFICYNKVVKNDELMQYFNAAINTYKYVRSGDRFHIAILDSDTENFYYELVVKP